MRAFPPLILIPTTERECCWMWVRQATSRLPFTAECSQRFSQPCDALRTLVNLCPTYMKKRLLPLPLLLVISECGFGWGGCLLPLLFCGEPLGWMVDVTMRERWWGWGGIVLTPNDVAPANINGPSHSGAPCHCTLTLPKIAQSK